MNGILQLLGRYTAATAVSLMVSLATFWGTLLVTGNGSPAVDFIAIALVGFAGVLSGAFCLHPGSRLIGAVLLLGMGLAFYCWLWLFTFGYSLGHIATRFPHFWELAAGGFGAVVCVWFRPRLKARKAVKEDSGGTF